MLIAPSRAERQIAFWLDAADGRGPGMSSLVYLRGELVDATTQYAELRDLHEDRHRCNRIPLQCTENSAAACTCDSPDPTKTA